jgi:hypothetical protein
MHARLGEVDFFWHDATGAFGYCIEVIAAGPGLDAFFDTVPAVPAAGMGATRSAASDERSLVQNQ